MTKSQHSGSPMGSNLISLTFNFFARLEFKRLPSIWTARQMKVTLRRKSQSASLTVSTNCKRSSRSSLKTQSAGIYSHWTIKTDPPLRPCTSRSESFRTSRVVETHTSDKSKCLLQEKTLRKESNHHFRQPENTLTLKLFVEKFAFEHILDRNLKFIHTTSQEEENFESRI